MELVIWRHPRPAGASGRCIGRIDIPVDRRKAKRLAHAVRHAARLHGWPREIWTSTLCRSAAVGRVLAAWGWVHRRDARLDELDFGRWEGRAWDEIGAVAVQAWCEDFAAHAPGGGESLAQLFQRCRSFLDARPGRGGPVLVIGHAGWMQAARMACAGQAAPDDAARWPAPPGYAEAWRLKPAPASSG